MLDSSATEELTSHRVATKTIRMFDVFLSSEAREHRLVRGSPSNSAAMADKPRASSSSRWSSKPPSELIEEPWNVSLTDRSNWSRSGPDSASPVAFAAESPLRHR